MTTIGLTRARSMGPVAEALARAGASVERVFARAAAPIGLILEPDKIITVRDMFTLVEHAARELGDDTMPIWLSAGAGVAWLGLYGAAFAVCSDLA